jgi:hypothetical protein
VAGVVATAVTQVDPAHESAIKVGAARVTQHDELLMMRTARAHPHVEQAAPTGGIDLLTEVAILALGELEAIQVRSPDEAPDHHASLGRLAQQAPDLGALTVEAFIGIATPVREEEDITSLHGPYGVHEGLEVLGPMDERPNLVA